MRAREPLHREVSDGSGVPLVLLHEGAGSSRDWDALLPALTAGGRRVVAYDRRGFGQSPRDTDYAADLFEEDAEDLAALLAELGSSTWHLLGHSDGGTVALLAAARYPSLVQSVAVVATHVRPDPDTVAAVRGLGPPASWPGRVAGSYRHRHGDDWQQVVSAWLTLWTDEARTTWDLTPDLGSIRCPVLAVHDRRDPLAPVLHAQEMGRSIPRVTLDWYDTGDHRPHRREPSRFLAGLTAHLAAASPPPG